MENALDEIVPIEAICLMDKAYIDFEALCRMQEYELFFVTREKSTLKYDLIE